ncbi:MAG: translation elongation factor Ts [bacterium]|nr:translation elongation factor Ts [bacterium]MDP2705680.1 translation elongation factor Ts [bacterium]
MKEDILKLRETTGAGVMDCKKAFDDAKGDFKEALKLIQERGLAKAEKKADRSTGAGILETVVHNGRVGVLLLLRCETDFVAHSDKFKELAHDLALHIAAMNPADTEEVLKQVFVKNPSLTIEDLIKGAIAIIGENIKLEKFARYEI